MDDKKNPDVYEQEVQTLKTGGIFLPVLLFINDITQKWECLPARCSITR